MQGIWRYTQFQDLPPDFRLSLNEGNTPLESIALWGMQVMLKREDKNPNGSFKDRSLAYQISYYSAQGQKRFAISSSGNAAISAAAYAQVAGAELNVFLAEEVDPNKLEKLENMRGPGVLLNLSKKPKSDAIKFCKAEGVINLRGSMDDLAIAGFKSIAYEIGEQISEPCEVFIPCSSGTSTLGIYQGMNEIGLQSKLFIAQTTKIHPIAAHFDSEAKSSPKSLASAISDRVAHRKAQVIEAVVNSGGTGWAISDNELLNLRSEIRDLISFEISYNSLLSLAAIKKALTAGWQLQKPVAIISGL